jgi:hypothetical protein
MSFSVLMRHERVSGREREEDMKITMQDFQSSCSKQQQKRPKHQNKKRQRQRQRKRLSKIARPRWRWECMVENVGGEGVESPIFSIALLSLSLSFVLVLGL